MHVRMVAVHSRFVVFQPLGIISDGYYFGLVILGVFGMVILGRDWCSTANPLLEVSVAAIRILAAPSQN